MPKGPVETLYKDYVVQKKGENTGYPATYVNSDLKDPKLVLTVTVEGAGGELASYVRGLS